MTLHFKSSWGLLRGKKNKNSKCQTGGTWWRAGTGQWVPHNEKASNKSCFRYNQLRKETRQNRMNILIQFILLYWWRIYIVLFVAKAVKHIRLSSAQQNSEYCKQNCPVKFLTFKSLSGNTHKNTFRGGYDLGIAAASGECLSRFYYWCFPACSWERTAAPVSQSLWPRMKK